MAKNTTLGNLIWRPRDCPTLLSRATLAPDVQCLGNEFDRSVVDIRKVKKRICGKIGPAYVNLCQPFPPVVARNNHQWIQMSFLVLPFIFNSFPASYRINWHQCRFPSYYLDRLFHLHGRFQVTRSPQKNWRVKSIRALDHQNENHWASG